MDEAAEKQQSLWAKISNTGAEGETYDEARRIILTNQIALLAFIVPVYYNIFYIIYDPELLRPVIMINFACSFISFTVLTLNYKKLIKMARYLIIIIPNIQIYLLTYYMSTASGMHLLHIMMVSFVLFLLAREKKTIIVTMASIPIVLFIIEYLFFTPELSPITLDDNILRIFYLTIAVTVFVLVVVFFALFYQQILYTENLLQNEYDRSERLLLNILPDEVAQKLKSNPGEIAEMFPSVTILFADIVGFTEIAMSVSPYELVDNLNAIFSKIDRLTEKYRLEKIKTIGDAYMVAGGIPVGLENHTRAVADFSLDLLEEMKDIKVNGQKINIRIGFHTGPVVAGVIGAKKFNYDVWGSAVNLASRLEAGSVIGKIHVSKDVYMELKDDYELEPRGKIRLKGVGEQETYFLTGRKT